VKNQATSIDLSVAQCDAPFGVALPTPAVKE